MSISRYQNFGIIVGDNCHKALSEDELESRSDEMGLPFISFPSLGAQDDRRYEQKDWSASSSRHIENTACSEDATTALDALEHYIDNCEEGNASQSLFSETE